MTTFDITLRDCDAHCTATFNTHKARAWLLDHRDSMTLHTPHCINVAWPDLSRLVNCWIADALTLRGP